MPGLIAGQALTTASGVATILITQTPQEGAPRRKIMKIKKIERTQRGLCKCKSSC